MQACLAAFCSIAGIILYFLNFIQCCTIYEFNGAGFAANAFAVAHMVPIFHNTNGTFFLDNTWNYYKCSEEGGWHDFFSWEDQVSSSYNWKGGGGLAAVARDTYQCIPYVQFTVIYKISCI